MNILPKKRWHVRTRENIARVRRDEAKAKEEEDERLRRIELAEKEARTNHLRTIARSKYDGRADKESTTDQPAEHVNFFKELEQGEDVVKGKNAGYEQEKKQETEKYEKQIGYLTYLGQDTVESTGNVSWFNKVPDRLRPSDEIEVDVRKKTVYDPLENMNLLMKNRYVKKVTKVETNEEKPKKRKRSSSSSSSECSKRRKKKKKHGRKSERESIPKLDQTRPTLDELRAKRLKREEEEKRRASQLLARLRGEPVEEPKALEPPKQKYNSQFNPHIARQNREDD